MPMKLASASIGHSPCCHPFNYHLNHLISPSYVTLSNQLVLSQQRHVNFSISFSLKTSPLEVIDGNDCLPNSKTPWLKLCPELDTKTGGVIDSFYSPVENRVVRLNRRDCLGVPETAICVASAGEWLGFVDPRDDCPVYLTNPYFSDKYMSVIRLPSIATLPVVYSVERDPETGLVEQYNLLDHSIDEWNLYPTRSCKADTMATSIHRLALSHPDPRHLDCVAIAAYRCVNDYYWRSSTIAYAHIWDDDPRTSLGWIDDEVKGDEEVVFSNTSKLFYAFCSSGILAIDLLSDRMKRSKVVLNMFAQEIRHQLNKEFGQEKNEKLKKLRNTCIIEEHLASLDDKSESSDTVLIIRYMSRNRERAGKHNPSKKTRHFDVFKVNFRGRELVRLTTLEDRCVFVGHDQSFTLCASKYPGLQPNSIYFNDSAPYFDREFTWNNDRGIFNLENNTIKRISCPYTPSNPLPQNGPADRSCWKRGEKLFWVSPSNITNS